MSNNQEAAGDLVRRIDHAVAAAEADGRLVDQATARQIAAAVHRGLGSELERFAGTGRLRRHHAARLELHYLTVDDPQMRRWREALLRFITNDQRQHRAERPGGDHDAPCA